MTRRQLIGPGVVVILVVSVVALAVTRSPSSPTSPGIDTPATPDAASAAVIATPSGTPRPAPGHEVYGFVPYWEMDATIADHLAKTDLTTLAMFSVTNARDGSLDTSQNGYKRITGEVGRRMIREAHDRGVRVELVFTSFGTARNARFFGSLELQDATIVSLVALTKDLGMDGINVDVEQLALDLVPTYGGFVERLRAAARAAIPAAQVSVSTGAGPTGAAMAASAATAGADRMFLMGYDYHTATSAPGASAPMARRDGGERDLVWSLDLYESVGVPVERTILGLPLYGVIWPVAGPALGEVQVGKGDTWVPADNLGILAAPPVPPETDPIEIVDFYALPPADGATPDPSDGSPAAGWQAVYVDSPETLTPKLALADERGLAGVGFWAIGYERGLPEYTDLIDRFRAGTLD
jgi:spore germination protein YaaH